VTTARSKGFGGRLAYDGGVKWLLLPAGLILLVFAADWVLLWMEWRGWIDYRRTDPGRIDPGQVGPAFLGIQALFQSGARHHLEEKNAVRTEREAPDGEP
jgi:hypothetical protein